MKAAVLFFLAFITSINCFSQLKPYNKAYIWRGFQHRWTYNHRCNRIGDYVVYNNDSATSTHCSATGLGADSTYYTSFYTYVASPNVVFKEGVTTIRINAKQKQLIEKTVTVSVTPEEWLQYKTDYITLLNGFDLRSDKGSEKIQLLRLAIRDGEYQDATGQISFQIQVSMVLNCQSIECPDNDNLAYDLDVHYLIVGLNKGEAAATQQYYTRSYSWDKKEELDEQPEERILSGVAIPNYPKATLGIKSFSFVLNEAHWMLTMNNDINPIDYFPASGRMSLAIDILFQEWEEGMRESHASPHDSRFAEKRNGWAMMDINTELLQFQQAKLDYQTHEGKMFWKGDNLSSNSDKAVQVYSIKPE